MENLNVLLSLNNESPSEKEEEGKTQEVQEVKDKEVLKTLENIQKDLKTVNESLSKLGENKSSQAMNDDSIQELITIAKDMQYVQTYQFHWFVYLSLGLVFVLILYWLYRMLRKAI